MSWPSPVTELSKCLLLKTSFRGNSGPSIHLMAKQISKNKSNKRINLKIVIDKLIKSNIITLKKET